MDKLHVKVRHLEISDYQDLYDSMDLAYTGLDDEPWKRKQMASLIKKFPEGQIAVEVNGKVVGCALAIIVDYAKFGDKHTYEQITANDTFATHDPDGDVLYGIDVFVHPEYRGMRLARRLYDARKELCYQLNLRSIVAGGRIPGYMDHSKDLTPAQYIEKVRLRELHDPILSFQLSNDFHVKKILRNYLTTDRESKSNATLLEWINIHYEDTVDWYGSEKKEIRLGVVQWQMRPAQDLEAVLNQAEYFIDTVSDYESDFILFPEFFNAPLFAPYNELNQAKAMRKLAEMTPAIIAKMREFAVHYNVNIIAGSLPEVKDGKLYNVAPFLRRDGSMEKVYKVHITPSESHSYAMSGGGRVKALDSDCGKIGILICYDVEFPELSRLLSDEGMRILFVPFMTDLKTGYDRVRLCSQARAVENECYVAIAGSIGNLPRIDNMDIQYAQSAVFSPSDFAFPSRGVVDEATPNTEMVLITDVDTTKLHELHSQGSVHNLKDRRKDLYELSWKSPRKSK